MGDKITATESCDNASRGNIKLIFSALRLLVRVKWISIISVLQDAGSQREHRPDGALDLYLLRVYL